MPKFRVFDGSRVKTPKPIWMNDSSKNPKFYQGLCFSTFYCHSVPSFWKYWHFVLKLYAKMQ